MPSVEENNPEGGGVVVPDAWSLDPLEDLALLVNYRSIPFEVEEMTELDRVVRFEGHAAVYGEETQLDIPGIGVVHEVIDRGAFRKILAQKPEVPMLYNHDPNSILADTANGTLTLKEDGKGLLTRAEMDRSDPDVQRVVAKIQSGLVRGMSFGFVAGRENQKIEHRPGGVLRRLSGFKKLLDVGPVVGPAYVGTDVALRSSLQLLQLQYAKSPESLQEILMGACPQLEEAAVSEDTDEEARTEDGASGAVKSIAARKRALQLFLLETGGCDDAS